MKKTVTVPFMLLGIFFSVCLITSNLLSTKVIKLGDITTITGGMLVFPISYIINDCIVEIWGYKKARMLIWIGFAANLFVLIFAQLVVFWPSPDFWDGESSFNFIFGLAPRIAIASVSAFLVGSFLNAYVMSRLKIYHKGKYFSFRAIVSTLVGETADSAIFFPIAFAGIVSGKDLLFMSVTETLLKSSYEVVVLPITIALVKYLKRAGNTDVYDHGISYSLLRVGDI